jgi:hypothetical protein
MSATGSISTLSVPKLSPSLDRTKESIAALEAAYALGSGRTTPKFVETVDQSEDYMRVFRLDGMTRRELQVFGSAKIRCNRARTHAMRGEALEAWRELGLAQHILQFFEPGSLNARLGLTERLAAEAAVHFQGNCFIESRASLEAVRAHDRAMADEFHGPGSLAHGFHLLGKQAQLETAERRYGLALEVAASGIRLLSGLHALLPTSLWPSSPVEAAPLPFLLRRMLSRQLVIEVGATLLHILPVGLDSATRVCRAALGDRLEFEALTPMDREFLAAVLSRGDPANPIAEWAAWAAFLEHSRSSAETLWLLGAFQAARSCAGLESAQAFRRRAFADLAAHAAFPARMRNAWRRLSQD